MKLVQVSNMAVMAVVAMVSVSASAATHANYCKTSAITDDNCKNIPGNRRDELGKEVQGGNPVAITNEGGNLKVWYTVGGADLKSCQVTNNVKSFKMSQNPGDRSTAYFLKEDGDLFDVKMSGYVSAQECPKASKQNYSQAMGISKSDDVVEYKLASNPNSGITMAARTRSNILFYSTDTKIELYGRYYYAQDADAKLTQILGN